MALHETDVEFLDEVTDDQYLLGRPSARPGSGRPGLLRLPGRLAGTFRQRGRKQFWKVSGYDQPVVVTLDAEEFDHSETT